MKDGPDFVIIGGMKCATSTLHDQLQQQPGMFLTEPKEPYFFSNDEVYAKGLDWYASLFKEAKDDDLCGESSTHYAKLPTYPKTIERLLAYKPDVKVVYVVRHPINRLVSQYIHGWTEQEFSFGIDKAIDQVPRLTEYSLYAMQLRPWIDAIGKDRIQLVFFDRLIKDSQYELERICKFLGYEGDPVWKDDLDASNVSAERERKSGLRDAIVYSKPMTLVRKKFVPQKFRDWVKGFWKMKGRPTISADRRSRLEKIFDHDLAELGVWFGLELNCENFKQVAMSQTPVWRDDAEIEDEKKNGKTGVVVIGRNEGERLKVCLQSAKQVCEDVVYVDSGSTDGSQDYAKSIGVDVVDLDMSVSFTMARGRNAGFERLLSRASDIEFVQFVDGDCEINADWLEKGRDYLQAHEDCAIVSGRRRERFLDASTYNRLTDVEWDTPIGDVKYCHGDAMMRMSVMQRVGGFNETLICGEEPELCVRVRQLGWKIHRLDCEMSLHDAAMTKFSQWWKRSLRAGWGYAEGAVMHGDKPEQHWRREMLSNWVYGFVIPLVAVLLSWVTWGLSLLLFTVYVRLYIRVYKSCMKQGHDERTARLYAKYTTLGKLPNAIGQLKYTINRLFGKQAKLIEYKAA
ncbi:sulfotransferase [Poriferisphaera sp. WC338]|uniref:sulfotransferase n=1 Tax=Poriferisphaera sp. WC338 TaxID=3425129 RepID=UPI003D81C305